MRGEQRRGEQRRGEKKDINSECGEKRKGTADNASSNLMQ
jgi:hypothetical protein